MFFSLEKNVLFIRLQVCRARFFFNVLIFQGSLFILTTVFSDVSTQFFQKIHFPFFLTVRTLVEVFAHSTSQNILGCSEQIKRGKCLGDMVGMT